MIDWITGWIHLLIIDYDIIAIFGMIFIYAAFNIWIFLWLNDRKKSSNYAIVYIIGITFFSSKIVIDSSTINQVPFYIKHNGKHINIVKKCAYEASDNSTYRYCVSQRIKRGEEIAKNQEFESKKKQILEK